MLQLVCLKSYGDFVIALRSVQRLSQQHHGDLPELVAGTHLRALADALPVTSTVRFVGDPAQTHVPAAYDLRRFGVAAALRSLIGLRQDLGGGGRSDIRLFDRVGWRERMLAGGSQLRGLPAVPNIYLAYAHYFEGHGLVVSPSLPLRRQTGLKALVFPASRVNRKVLPRDVINGALSQLRSLGYAAEVLLLEGEQVDLPPNALVNRQPRNFPSLVDAICGADLVVSADSLPAHLGEFFGIPTFVISPQPNEYWLPEAAFATRGWCTFNDAAGLSRWVHDHSAQNQFAPSRNAGNLTPEFRSS